MVACRKAPNTCLLQPLTAGVQQDHCALLASQRLNGVNEWLGPHQHPGTTTVRLIVNGAVLPNPPLAEIVNLEFGETTLNSAGGDARRECGAHRLRKERNNINAQRCHLGAHLVRTGFGGRGVRTRFGARTVNSDPAMFATMIPSRGLNVTMIEATEGRSISPPSGVRRM